MFISATAPLPGLPTETFEYDGVGNRTNAGSYLYDSANRLMEDDRYTYTYDNNGNMLTRTEKATGDTTTYTYNAENQLVRVDFPSGGFASYRYDGLGRRIEKNLNGTIIQYIYDNEDIILETDGDGNILTRYTHGPGIDEPLIMDTMGSSYYYHTDGLGSITKMTNPSGDIVLPHYEYDSFGNMIPYIRPQVVLPSDKNPYTYTGREYDSETGLYYYRARYYDPRIGRFLQEDPIGFIGGVNFYTYCWNNPINRIDPFGLYMESKIKGITSQDLIDLILGVGTAYADELRNPQIERYRQLLNEKDRLLLDLLLRIGIFYVGLGGRLVTVGVIILPSPWGIVLIVNGVYLEVRAVYEFADWSERYAITIRELDKISRGEF